MISGERPMCVWDVYTPNILCSLVSQTDSQYFWAGLARWSSRHPQPQIKTGRVCTTSASSCLYSTRCWQSDPGLAMWDLLLWKHSWASERSWLRSSWAIQVANYASVHVLVHPCIHPCIHHPFIHPSFIHPTMFSFPHVISPSMHLFYFWIVSKSQMLASTCWKRAGQAGDQREPVVNQCFPSHQVSPVCPDMFRCGGATLVLTDGPAGGAVWPLEELPVTAGPTAAPPCWWAACETGEPECEKAAWFIQSPT